MNKKLKVLEVLDCYYPNVDGPIEVMNNIARSFESCGFGEVELLVPDYPRTYRARGAENSPLQVRADKGRVPRGASFSGRKR